MEENFNSERRQSDVNYGMLLQRVKDMDRKMDKLEADVASLLALANRSKGGFWMGMTFASFFGGFITWAMSHWK
jgi:uncharacterized protein YukE